MNCNDNNIDNGNCQCSGIATSNNGDAQEEDLRTNDKPCVAKGFDSVQDVGSKSFFY